MKPLVSIITPSLNQAAYLAQTILSVRRQTYAHIEHIVVDGGSEDGSLEILRLHARSSGLRWISEPDRGMYHAINKGLRLATGSVVGYLNADDLYFPWTVEAVVQAMEAKPDVGVVFGDVMRIREFDGTLTFYFHPPINRGSIASGSRNQPAWFWRREVSDHLKGFDETLQFAADLDFRIRACLQFQSRRVDEFLAMDRLHRRSKRYTMRDVGAQEREAILARYRTGGVVERVWEQSYSELHKSFWKRYLLVKFLLARASRNRRAWSRLLAVESFMSIPWYGFVVCFLPFGYQFLRVPMTDVKSTILSATDSRLPRL